MIGALAVAAYRYARQVVTRVPQADRFDDMQARAVMRRELNLLALEAYDSGNTGEAWRLHDIAASYTPIPE